VLVQFRDQPIRNLYDFTDALRRSKVGDVKEVQVLRDGKPFLAKVRLEQRPARQPTRGHQNRPGSSPPA